MTTYDIECPTHRLTLIPDKVVLSRAWASLPQMLQIFRLEDTSSQFGTGNTNYLHVAPTDRNISVSLYFCHLVR